MALLLGLLSAVAWPLVMRVALPVALFTLGLGSFLLFGAAVLGALLRRPGRRTSPTSASGSSSPSRSPRCPGWSAACSPSTATSCSSAGPGAGPVAPDGADERPPGVLFLQIDALAYDTARRAVRDGSMPNLAAWLRVGQPHDDLLAHRLELADRRRPSAASCTAPTTTSSGSAGTRRTATTSPASRTRSTPPRSSGGTPTAAACSPATAPAAATCSPATPRTSA